MSRNHKFFFDQDGSPKARGPVSEKMFMAFLEVDVQGSDYICRELMDDLTAVEDNSDEPREFIGNAHQLTITPEGVLITPNQPNAEPEPSARVVQGTSAQTRVSADASTIESDGEQPTNEPIIEPGYMVPLKHFREILEDWEAFILDDQLDDPMADEEFS